MSTTESRRRDLYNGLSESIGPERAETLMAYLPNREYDDLATRSDLVTTDERLSSHIGQVERSLSARIDQIESSLTARIDQVESSLTARIDQVEATLSGRIDKLDTEMIHRFDAMNQRLDHIVLTLAGGLVAIIVAMIVQGFI